MSTAFVCIDSPRRPLWEPQPGHTDPQTTLQRQCSYNSQRLSATLTSAPVLHFGLRILNLSAMLTYAWYPYNEQKPESQPGPQETKDVAPGAPHTQLWGVWTTAAILEKNLAPLRSKWGRGVTSVLIFLLLL